MIIEIRLNKYTKEVNLDILSMYRNWFLSNPDIWFKGEDLEKYIGKTGPRKFINKLRCEGLPIISNRNGYKLSNNKKEIEDCYKKLRNRALRQLTSARLMKKNMK